MKLSKPTKAAKPRGIKAKTRIPAPIQKRLTAVPRLRIKKLTNAKVSKPAATPRYAARESESTRPTRPADATHASSIFTAALPRPQTSIPRARKVVPCNTAESVPREAKVPETKPWFGKFSSPWGRRMVAARSASGWNGASAVNCATTIPTCTTMSKKIEPSTNQRGPSLRRCHATVR